MTSATVQDFHRALALARAVYFADLSCLTPAEAHDLRLISLNVAIHHLRSVHLFSTPAANRMYEAARFRAQDNQRVSEMDGSDLMTF